MKGIVAAIVTGVAALLLLLTFYNKQDAEMTTQKARHEAEKAEFDRDFARFMGADSSQVSEMEQRVKVARDRVTRAEIEQGQRDARQQQVLDQMQQAAAKEVDRQAGTTISEELAGKK